jgi:hypothetical protein
MDTTQLGTGDFRTIEDWVINQITAEEPEPAASMQVLSIRVWSQTIGDLEDLAGRLDITRTELARRLIEIGISEAEAAYDRLHAAPCTCTITEYERQESKDCPRHGPSIRAFKERNG